MQRLLNQSYYFFFFMISTPLLIQWDFVLSLSLSVFCVHSKACQRVRREQMGEKCIRKQGRVIEGYITRKEGKKDGQA